MRGRGTVFRPLFAAAGAYLSLASACMASPAVMPQAAGSSSTPSAQRATWARARIRAAEALRRMTPEEKTTLTIGILAIPFGPDPPPLPAEAVPGAGYVPGIPRLGIPALRNNIDLWDCFQEVYHYGIGLENGQVPNDPELPLPFDKVHPINEVVRVDYFLPGCPPPADAIWKFLTDLAAGREPKLDYEMLHFD